MEKEFVNYEQALALKELGFDEPCLKTMLDFDITYGSDVKMPLFQQTFRWFREKYKMYYVIVKAESWFYTINGCNTQEGFNTYEEAELACLNKLIEIVKGGEQ